MRLVLETVSVMASPGFSSYPFAALTPETPTQMMAVLLNKFLTVASLQAFDARAVPLAVVGIAAWK